MLEGPTLLGGTPFAELTELFYPIKIYL